MDLKNYEEFKAKNYNTSFLMNKFIFQNENVKKFFISQEKSNYDFYYFLGKNLQDVQKVAQIGFCGGYYIGLFLLINKDIKEIYFYDINKNNKQILRLTKNNLLGFKNFKKNYELFNLEKDLFEKISYLDCELLIIFDFLFLENNLEITLSLSEKNKFIKYLILDNVNDEINFQNKIKNFCIIRNIAFEKFNKRNDAIVLRKI